MNKSFVVSLLNRMSASLASTLLALVWSVLIASSPVIAVESALTVRNIAELQALDTTALTTTNCVYVQGYYNPGDRGGGAFKWQISASNPVDGGRYLASLNTNSPAGRWERMLNGETANIKMWGAWGDVYECYKTTNAIAAAHDDYIPIQNALDAIISLSSSGGYWTTELLFPAGCYKVTNTLVFQSGLFKIRGECVNLTTLIMPYGIQKDIMHDKGADDAINLHNGTAAGGGGMHIEEISFLFASQNGAQSAHNSVNAALVLCLPQEGNSLRNVITDGGAYGIRCFGGGNGAPAAFRDIVCTGAAVAGLSIEPIPGGDHACGHVSIIGVTGDHFWDESRSNACLVLLSNFCGAALIQDLNAEGAYGGGAIQHKFPDYSAGWSQANEMGLINIRNCVAGFGPSASLYATSNAFLVLKGGDRTASVTMEHITFYGGPLIRDEVTGRVVPCPDAYASGLSQGCCRVPTSYEAIGHPGILTRSRLVVGDTVIYSFVPPDVGWYRVMDAIGTQGRSRIGGKLQVTTISDSCEFHVDVLISTYDTLAAAINVVRASRDASGGADTTVTQARAGIYKDGSNNPSGFTDIYVSQVISGTDIEKKKITIAYPLFDANNLTYNYGNTPLLTPTTPLAGGDPLPNANCQLIQCVTNSLIR